MIGSGLEGAGVTQDISTDPQSAIGSQLGQIGSMFAGANPQGAMGDLAQNMSQTQTIQQMSGIFMKHGGMNYKYKQGGMAEQGDIEAESGELLLTGGGQPKSLNTNAGLTNLGNGAYEIKGTESHKKGGVPVKLPSGETIIITNQKGRSSRVKEAYAKIAAANKKINSGDFIDAQTGELEKRNAEAIVQKEIAEQQNDNGNQTNIAKYGGRYMKAKNGVRSIGLGNNNIFPEGISSSMYGLGFNPQTISGLEPGPFSNMDQSMSVPLRGVHGGYEGRRTIQPKMNYGGKYMKAQEGMLNFNLPSVGPYSTTSGALMSGGAMLPGMPTGMGTFDMNIGHLNQAGTGQNMFGQFDNPGTAPALYGYPTAPGQQAIQNMNSTVSQSPYPQGDPEINLGNELSVGVFMDDINPAPVMGPQNMPEGYAVSYTHLTLPTTPYV